MSGALTADGHEIPEKQIPVTIYSDADLHEMTDEDLINLGKLVVAATKLRREGLGKSSVA